GWDGAWHWDDHGDGGAGPTNVMHSPGVMTYWVGGSQRAHVFLVGGPAHHVYDHWWDGTWHWDSPGNPGVSLSAAYDRSFSTPAARADWNGFVTQVHAFLTDTQHGNLYDLYSNDDGATWHFDNHGNGGSYLRGAPGVATYPSGNYNQLHVLVSSVDGPVYDHWWDGTWHWN